MILSLQWRNVNLERKELVIEATKAKTRTARIVPMSTRLKSILAMRRLDPAGSAFGPDAFVFGNEVGEQLKSIRELWEATREAAGMPTLQLRDLRHEAGSRFDEAGVPTNYVSKILGHTNLTTTSRYLNIHRRGLQSAMQKLEEHRAQQKTASSEPVAQPLHTDGDSSPAVAPASDHRRARAGTDPRRPPCTIERACAALPADFPAEIRDSITAGALSRRALINATASK